LIYWTAIRNIQHRIFEKIERDAVAETAISVSIPAAISTTLLEVLLFFVTLSLKFNLPFIILS